VWLSRGTDEEYDACLDDFRGSRDGHELMSLSAHLGKPRLKVLDYGAGWGLWPIIATRLGHDASATELSPDKADHMIREGVTVIGDEDIHRHRFDVINLEQTLEHLPAPRTLLEMLVPSLSGVLKIAVPNAAYARIEDFERGDFSRLPILLPFEHVNGFTRQSLTALIESVGLREIRPSHRYAWLSGGIPKQAKRALKELVRPFYRNPANIYAWFVRR
jgi:hypothetical protein